MIALKAGDTEAYTKLSSSAQTYADWDSERRTGQKRNSDCLNATQHRLAGDIAVFGAAELQTATTTVDTPQGSPGGVQLAYINFDYRLAGKGELHRGSILLYVYSNLYETTRFLCGGKLLSP